MHQQNMECPDATPFVFVPFVIHPLFTWIPGHISMHCSLPTACSRLIAKDNVGGVESLSVFSLHSIKTYQGLDSSGCASLAPAYLLPQTHPQCGQKTTESAINSTADLQQRQKDQQCAASEAFLPDGPMAASNSRQLPDFPATGDQVGS